VSGSFHELGFREIVVEGAENHDSAAADDASPFRLLFVPRVCVPSDSAIGGDVGEPIGVASPVEGDQANLGETSIVVPHASFEICHRLLVHLKGGLDVLVDRRQDRDPVPT
jgi:hypothetical protein